MAGKKPNRARQSKRRKKSLHLKTQTELAPLATTPVDESLVKPTSAWWMTRFLPGLVVLSLLIVYAYLPTLQWVVNAWRTEPDYSHGFIVLPLAALILYHRTEWFPGLRQRTSYWGLALIAVAILMRLGGRMVYADFLDGWSIVPLLAGIVWYLFGVAAMKWALPAIAFLVLMIPLPYQAETLLSWKLQGVATQLSTGMLRVFGQPAVAEGHVIWINNEPLMVEQACSGLRIFVGVGALAYFWAAVANRIWIDRVVIIASALPIAIFANATRVTLIGLLYTWFDSSSSRHLIHDITGIAMIPFSFCLLWLVKTFCEHLYRPVQNPTAKNFLPPDPALAG